MGGAFGLGAGSFNAGSAVLGAPKAGSVGYVEGVGNGYIGDRESLIVENSKGKYVQAETQVIKSDNPDEWESEIQSYVNEQVRNGKDVIIPTEDGDNIVITGRTAWKLSDRGPLDDEFYKAKGNASGAIDEIIETSKYKRSKPLLKERKGNFAKNGFDYRIAYFRDLDGQYYKMKLSVGLNTDGKEAYNLGNIEKVPFPISGSKTVDGSKAIGMVPRNNLPQNDGIVNTNSMQNGGKDAKRQNLFTENGGLSGIELYRLGRALIGSENAGEVDFDGSVPGAQLAARYISTQEAMKLLERSGVKISKAQAENLKNHHNQRAELARAIARTFGVNVRFGGVQPGALAQYEKSTNTIYLNPSEKVSVMKELAEGHEIVHAIEQTPNYAKISQLVIENAFGGVNSDTYIAEASRLDAIYKRMGKNLSSEELQQEVVAEYFRTKVFKDAKALTDFIIENHETLGKEFFLNLKGISDKVKQVFNEKILGKTGDVPTPPLSDQILTEFASAMNQHRRDRNREIVGERLDTVAEGYGLVDGKSSVESNLKFFASNSPETISIKQQIRDNLETINELEPVAEINYQTGKSKKQVYDEIVTEFKKIGWKVDRQNFGIIEVTPSDIRTGLNYLSYEPEFAAMYSVPKVLKQGRIIHQGDHKGRGHDTITIAAPVVLNGTPGIVGVVVKQTKGNHYKTHRVLMPDGSMFEFNKNEEARIGWMTDASTGESQPITSSDEIVPQNLDGVKRKGLITESSVSEAEEAGKLREFYDESVPDEAFAEQARLEAEEFLESPDVITEEDIEKRYQYERDLFDGALKDVKVEQLSNTEYLKTVSGNIVKAHEIFKNVRRRADNVIFLNHTTAIDKMHSTIYN